MKRSTKTTETTEALQLEKLLTVDDTANILGVSKVQVYKLMKIPELPLPSLKINGARRIVPSKLKAWIEQHYA